MILRYAFLPALCLAFGVQAQRVDHLPSADRPSFAGPVQPRAPQQVGTDRGPGDIVFTEDFANGLAGNNGNGPWTTEGANGNIWKHTLYGPEGAYTTAAEILTSPSVGNGFMLFNSDSANTNWNDTTMVASPTAWEGSLVSPLLDLSATPYVLVRFQQYVRYCCSDRPHFLEVSTDGGTQWTSQFPTSLGVAANDGSGTEVREINITGAIAADPGNVKIRFRHDSEAGTSHYHWQIDDVEIVEIEEYDLSISNAANTQFVLATALSYDSLQYSIFPYSQLRPLGLNMEVFNNGSIAQDAVSNFTVMRGTTEVLDQDQPVPALEPGETRTVFVSPDFTPPAEAGNYTVTYNISSGNPDVDPTNNTATSNFRVSEYIYARDAGNPWTFQVGDSSFMILSNAFYVANTVTLQSIAVIIGTGSEVGAFIVGDIRQDDLETVIAESQEYSVTNSMMNGANGTNFTHLIFDPPVELPPGDYMVSIQCTGRVRVGQSGTSVPQTSFIFYDGASGLDWYYTTTTPSLRMNFDASVGIDDQADLDNGISAYSIPNPSNGNTRLVYELNEAAPVTVELMDVSGKLVMSFNEGNKAPGQHQLMFDVTGLNEGVYFHVVRAGDAQVTGRMVVVK